MSVSKELAIKVLLQTSSLESVYPIKVMTLKAFLLAPLEVGVNQKS